MLGPLSLDLRLEWGKSMCERFDVWIWKLERPIQVSEQSKKGQTSQILKCWIRMPLRLKKKEWRRLSRSTVESSYTFSSQLCLWVASSVSTWAQINESYVGNMFLSCLCKYFRISTGITGIITYSVLVSSGFYNKVAYTGCLVHHTNLFLIVLEVRSLRSECQHGWLLERALFLIYRLPNPHHMPMLKVG